MQAGWMAMMKICHWSAFINGLELRNTPQDDLQDPLETSR
jgi:hypothetical protein